MLSQAQLDGARRIADAAVWMEQRHGLPADISMAQSILESGWLAHAPKNNAKGIKAARLDIPSRAQLLETLEWFTEREAARFRAMGQERRIITATGRVRAGGRREYRVMDWFRTYVSLEECFEHWSLVMRNNPRFATATTQYRADVAARVADANIRFLTAIAPIYATADPAFYVGQITSIMRMRAVQQILQAARNELKVQ